MDGAAHCLQQALRLEPANVRALNALGVIALQRGELGPAIELLRRAISLEPKQPGAHVNLGNAFARLGRFDDSIGHYDAALQLRPKDVEALYNRSTAFLYSNRAAEAAEGYRRVLAIVQNHANALYNLAVAAERLGRFEEVADVCRRFVRLNAGDVDAHIMRLRALNALGRTEEIRSAIDAAVAGAVAVINPANAAAAAKIAELARLLLDIGEAERALPLLERALRTFTASPELFGTHGLVLADVMRQADAVASYDRALALRGYTADVLTHRGSALFQLGKFDAAIDSYDRALQTGQGAPTILINLVGAKKFQNRDDPHLKTIEFLLADVGQRSLADQMYLRFAAGKAFDDLGRYDEAFEQWTAGNRARRQLVPYDVGPDLELHETYAARLTKNWLSERLSSTAGAAPIFVFGMPRSGTTLVEQLIAAHPDAIAIGETGFFKKALADATRKRPASEPLIDKVQTLGRSDFERIGQAYAQAARERGGSATARLVDKTLSTSLEAPLVAAAMPDAIFVHVRRDALDNCLACFSSLFASGHEFSYGLQDIAAYRLSYEQMIAQWQMVLPPNRFIEVEYEQLVRDFESQAKRLIGVCGLPWDRAVLDFSKVDRPVRSASAFQVRQGLFTSSIGRWRHYRSGLAAVEQMLGPARTQHAAAS